MDGHSHWRGESSVEPRRRHRGGGQSARRARTSAQPRRGFVLFAVAMTLALGAVVTLIATSSVQAMSHSAAFQAKSDSWVGLAAVASVLVCALLGAIIVHRYTTSRNR